MPTNTAAQMPSAGNVDNPPDWNPLQRSVTTAVASSLGSAAALSSDPEALRRAIDEAVVAGLQLALQRAADRWGAEVVGAERHQQVAGRVGYRSGSRRHAFHFSVGPVTISVPKPRQGASRPAWVPALKRAPERLKEVCRELWLRGLSSRDLSAVSQDVAGRNWCHTSMNGRGKGRRRRHAALAKPTGAAGYSLRHSGCAHHPVCWQDFSQGGPAGRARRDR